MMLNNEHKSLPPTGQDGELVLVLLNKGPVLARYVREHEGAYEIELANKSRAQLPPNRVLLSIVMDVQPAQGIKALNKELRGLANKMNLHEIWYEFKDSQQQFSNEQIANIYFGHLPTPQELIALVMHLETSCIYFYRKDSVYCSADEIEVEKKLADITSRVEKKQLVESLAKSLQAGTLPDPLPAAQKALLNHLRSFAIHGNNYSGYKPALEVIQLIQTGPKNKQQKAWELLKAAKFVSEKEPIELEREDIPIDFPQRVSDQVKLIQDLSSRKEDRRDLTNMFTITVDNKATRDRDDAISIELQGKDAVLLGIHITDVGAIIEKDSAIDIEARLRDTSIYLPDLTINMLPNPLSEGILSLRHNSASPALSVMAKFSSSKLEEWEIFTSYIKPNQIMSYEDLDTALIDPQSEHHAELAAFEEIARSLRSLRRDRGAILLNRPTLDITVEPDNSVSLELVPTDTRGRLAIAEAMVLANSLLAELCTQTGLPIIYRAQDKIDAEPYETLSPNNSDPVGQYELMRKMPPAYMTTVGNKHSGLGLDHYVQATAPIRRFCDLVIQRQISHSLEHQTSLYSALELENIVQCSATKLKRISSATSERKRYWLLKWMESRMDDGLDEYHAVVLASNVHGLGTLEMAEFPFRFKAQLSDFDKPGDIVNVRLGMINMWSKVPKFNVI